MRVIAGIAKGKSLKTLEGNDTVRPTTDRVKEALFSAIHFDLPNAHILDMFAGSGGLGIEALSRGANSAVFLDCSQNAIAIINQNLKYCGLEEQSQVVCTDYKVYLSKCTDVFDLVFIDPPYHLNIFNEAISSVSSLVSDNGIIVCEHPIDATILDIPSYKRRDYKYGKIAVTIFRKEAE